ncbi:MAG: hypothetical protein QXR60_00500 [Candidatus Nanoarchaeia archaeon]
MSLADKVEFFVKKKAAGIALRIVGYKVYEGENEVRVFESGYEFCRLQRKPYISVNDILVDKKHSLTAYLLDRKKHRHITNIFKYLRINIEHPYSFVSPNGDIIIVDK